MVVHLVAHARPGLLPLLAAEHARWLWQRLRAAFPDTLGAVLMPDHLHLIALLAACMRRRLAAVLGSFARRFDLGEVWQPVPEPSPCASVDKVQRALRYVALNPVRPWQHFRGTTKLVADPLMWPWSTLRDVVGAVAEPWVKVPTIAERLGWNPRSFQRNFHRYVSADPHVAVDGTPFPLPALPSKLPSASLTDVQRATLAATRESAAAFRRRGPARTMLLALAFRQGLKQPRELGQLCGIHPRSVSRRVRSCPDRWLDAAALCLGDERLRFEPGC